MLILLSAAIAADSAGLVVRSDIETIALMSGTSVAARCLPRSRARAGPTHGKRRAYPQGCVTTFNPTPIIGIRTIARTGRKEPTSRISCDDRRAGLNERAPSSVPCQDRRSDRKHHARGRSTPRRANGSPIARPSPSRSNRGKPASSISRFPPGLSPASRRYPASMWSTANECTIYQHQRRPARLRRALVIYEPPRRPTNGRTVFASGSSVRLFVKNRTGLLKKAGSFRLETRAARSSRLVQ